MLKQKLPAPNMLNFCVAKCLILLDDKESIVEEQRTSIYVEYTSSI